AFAVNTDLVKEGEIKGLQDLLDPKWKGKMTLADVRTGFMFRPADEIRRKLGEGSLKQLLVDQEPTFTRDFRQLADGLVRGKYPIAGGLTAPDLREFKDAGQAKNVKYVDVPEADYLVSTTAFLFKRAPHPNAAKIMANWLLTKEGQTIWSKALDQNSRRKDVPIANQETAPRAGMQFVNPETEETLPQIDQTQVIINKMVGISN
ncbi:MAG: extracellular solute-binding protein, partial [Chloroflexota bacterium]